MTCMNEFSVFYIHLPIELCKGLKQFRTIALALKLLN